MKAYIRSATAISPQKTLGSTGFLQEPVEYTGNRLTCIEPDYNAIIDVKLSRRMGRIIKMSVAAAFACLKAAGIPMPNNIVTGTAYGCLEDTGTFLTNMVEQDEEPVTPTAFVHSTHNTIGAQIALLLKCHAYNNTFVSGGASFENALQDALMLLAETETTNVLAGGMDEITNASHTVLGRMGLYRRQPVLNTNLFRSTTKGTIGGEGSAFFMLTNTPSEHDLSQLNAVATLYKPEDIAGEITAFLLTQEMEGSDIDLLLLGNNGDERNDAIYTKLQQTALAGIPAVNYKHLCGEYPTSSAFAMWLGANIIKTNTIPAALGTAAAKSKINKVLIYNHYQNINHSLLLLSSC